MAFGWRVPEPDEAMLISGGKQRGGAPYRVVTGHGAFVVPIRSRASFLTLAMNEANVVEDCVTQQGITLTVKAVIAFKVGSDPESIMAAAQRFLADQDKMAPLTGQIFAGHLRSIVGSMTVQDIIQKRQELAGQVIEGSKIEMAKLGLIVDSLQIQSIDDKGVGFITAMAAPHLAKVNQDASIAQAMAAQNAAEAEQESQRNQAEYARQTAVIRAQYQAQIDGETAKAGQAGPLAAAQATQNVLVEQAKVAARNAELREAQLIAEVVKPAEAEAERVRILARAEADRTSLAANAAATSDRIALDQAIIGQLPEIVEAASAGLQGSNLTILNGAEGLNATLAGLASQGTAIMRAVMGEMRSNADGRGGNGVAPARVVAPNGTVSQDDVPDAASDNLPATRPSPSPGPTPRRRVGRPKPTP